MNSSILSIAIAIPILTASSAAPSAFLAKSTSPYFRYAGFVFDPTPRSCREVLAAELRRRENPNYYKGWVLDAAEQVLAGLPLDSSAESEFSPRLRSDIRAAAEASRLNSLCKNQITR